MNVIQTEEDLFKALDKGIEDMENGKVYDFEDAMAMVRQRLKDYSLQHPKNNAETTITNDEIELLYAKKGN